jgi:acetylornithine deacetylase/succinyl-diaminopimelate desuccinylase-like protein
MSEVLSFIEASNDRIMRELAEFIAIPSVSTKDENRQDVVRCARWLCDHMTAMGIASEVVETARHPVVYGQWLGARGKPTLLVYGHYDVQPAEPLDLWETPPFQMSEREGFLYARGISDDKGQLFIHLKAAEAFLKTLGSLPVNVKFMLEGEEEIGSPSLTKFLEDHRDRLRADVAVISDNPMLGRGLPAVGYGLRGLAYGEVVLHGPRGDLHSGRFGGAVDNPANVLCRILAALRDERGRVTIPGFYDAVRPMTGEERAEIAGLPVGEAFYLEASGAPALAPEEGYGPVESIWARPTMDLCGLASGFQGKGAKTIIPSSAGAKISFRLVPDQTPEDVLDRLEARLRELCPPSVTMEFIRHEGAYPAMVDRADPSLVTARAALEEGFGKPCYLIRQGGTIPVVSQLKKVLGLGTLLLGFGLPDENAHAPNEKLLMENFRGGMKSIVRLYEMMGR